MLQLNTTRKRTKTRTALGLYGILLVLPMLVIGWLYWRELQQDYQNQLSKVPENAQDGARRIVSGMRDRLDKLIATEAERPFFHYGAVFSPTDSMGDDMALQPSPMIKQRAPKGVLAWFSFDRLDGPQGEIDVFVGSDTLASEDVITDLKPVVSDFRQRKSEEGRLRRVAQLDGIEPTSIPLSAVAVNLGHESDLDCLRRCSELMQERVLAVGVSEFHLQFYIDDSGAPHAVASRRVFSMEPLQELPPEAHCLKPLLKGFGLHQGFLIDVGWLFRDLPWNIAGQALGEAEELQYPPQALPIDNIGSVFAELYPVRDLGFEIYDPDDEAFGKLEVAINTERIKERFDSQSRKFLAVALMLILTLVTGIAFLYRSVNRELEQAHRMQNFVAAVTHELRTPLSTIRLHGEMLLDGWASEPEKQKEYYRRIVRETDRLSTLVERVLEKSRLKENVSEPEPGNLNEGIMNLAPTLEHADGSRGDLAFELATGLPEVWMTPESVAGILSNLVENARKYAPVSPGHEPILVRTLRMEDRVALEVADRGPGVPAGERDHIFEAFYRVGSEATRTATGTGLGLHLVRIHAEAVDAKASVYEREGGGSVFRVAFRPTD